MSQENETITLEQAKNQVALVARRLALLHLAFAETLVQELGDERGKQTIVQAIRNYGQKIAGPARQAALEQNLPLTPENFGAGGPSWPSIGAHDADEEIQVEGETRHRIHGCMMAKVWQEYGGQELGRLYCLVDPAKLMSYNPDLKLIHLQAEPDGDACCELVLRKTTAQERQDFANDGDWSYIDKG
jgi:hypothetical protein